ncbi:hypothetical protein [Saccharopolyspora sp. 6V]|uniref:zinc finger domain-containing protein n=1 Tax=Saccharopolyspora sp. 6V TaxID=2877239 RepID=UPI001CD36147|nr:hypothetical protein [Saccharopolyspora sp. 6V]MCA1195112.1 hypothetical protein [Saccharopolyspora sp. 6V]
MNRHDVQTILGAAAAIDPTIPAPSAVVLDMWVAMLDDIPADHGRAAVRDYYRSPTYRETRRTITPADVVGHYRDPRKAAAERRHHEALAEQRAAIAAAPAPVVSLAERYARLHAERTGEDPDVAEADAAARRVHLAVPCPHCKARPWVRCTGYNGHPMTRHPSHPSRIEAAQSVSHA